MTTDDKVHPSSKPTTAAANNNPSFPATKSQLYGATRPTTFRPQRNRNHDRNLCRTLCIYLCLLLLFLLILFAAVITVFYLLFHPHTPSFTLTSLNISSSSLSSSTLNFDLTLSTTNPNSKIVFSYQPASVSILAGDTSVAGGTLPAFDQAERNTTVLMASIESSESRKELRNEAGAEKGVLAVKLMVVTKVEAKMGPLKTPYVGITVLCDGASVAIPATRKGTEAPAAADMAAETVKPECKVDVRFKVWKWNV